MKDENEFRLAIISVLIIIVGVIVMFAGNPYMIKIIGFYVLLIGCSLYLVWTTINKKSCI